MKKLLLSLVFCYVNSKIILKYDGIGFEKNIIEQELKSSSTTQDILNRLEKFHFKSVNVVPKGKNLTVFIQDSDYVTSVEFIINFRELNVIKSKKYKNCSSWKPISKQFFTLYENISGLKDLDHQIAKQINAKDIALSLDKLKQYFIYSGYINVKVGYKILKEEEEGKVKIVYFINLGAIQNLNCEIIEESQKVKKEIYKSIDFLNFSFTNFYENFSLFDIGKFYQEQRIIKYILKNIGYIDADLNFYFDSIKNKYFLEINKKDFYELTFCEKNIDYSANNMEKLDKITVEEIEKIVNSKNFNDYKIETINKILKAYYSDYEDYSFNVKFGEKNKEKKTLKLKIFISKPKFPQKILSDIEVKLEEEKDSQEMNSAGPNLIKSHLLERFLSKKRGDLISQGDLKIIEKSISHLFSKVNASLKTKKDKYILVLKVSNIFKKVTFDYSQQFRASFQNWNIKDTGYVADANIVVDFSNIIRKSYINFILKTTSYNNLTLGGEIQCSYKLLQLSFFLEKLRITFSKIDDKIFPGISYSFDLFRSNYSNFLCTLDLEIKYSLKTIFRKIEGSIENRYIFSRELSYGYKGSAFITHGSDPGYNSSLFTMCHHMLEKIYSYNDIWSNSLNINLYLRYDLHEYCILLFEKVFSVYKSDLIKYDYWLFTSFYFPINKVIRIIPFPISIEVYYKIAFYNSNPKDNKNGFGLRVSIFQ